MKIWAFVALISAIFSAAYAARGVACERDVLSLNCGDGLLLHINSAFYGRRGRDQCDRTPIYSNHCGMDTTPVVKDICEHRQSCQVEAVNALHGDGCWGTLKYLDVDYQCRQPTERVVTACEGNALSLECPANTGIYIVDAMYGRHGRHTCTNDNAETKRCSVSHAKTIVKRKCDGGRACSVMASNVLFGDPCFEISKYLTVRYGCAAV